MDFQGSHITSDGALILVRELDERLDCGDLIVQHLGDSRRGKNTQLPLVDLLSRSIYSRLAGYEDVNDAERLACRRSRPMLADEENFAGLPWNQSEFGLALVLRLTMTQPLLGSVATLSKLSRGSSSASLLRRSMRASSVPT